MDSNETVSIWEIQDFQGLKYWGIVGHMPLDTAERIYGRPSYAVKRFTGRGSMAESELQATMTHAHFAMDIAKAWAHDDLMERPRREFDAHADQLQAARKSADADLAQWRKLS